MNETKKIFAFESFAHIQIINRHRLIEENITKSITYSKNELKNTLLRAYRLRIVYKDFYYYRIYNLNYDNVSKQKLIIFNSFLPEPVFNETFQ